MKEIPAFDIELSQSVDYILGSGLAKRAFEEPPFKNYGNILVELIESIDRLADNCHMPYVDFQKALGEEYARRDEKEVLLPPFVEISMEKAEMNKAEKKAVRDLKGSRPEEKYKVETKGFSCYSGETEEDELLRGRETAVEALKAMNQGEWQQDFSAYIAWKKQLRDYLENRFWRIWTSFPENHLQQLTGEKGSDADGQQVNADSRPDAKNQ